MKDKPYQAKSLKGAQTEVRLLRRRVRELAELLEQYSKERRLLAKLAAEGPTFVNWLNVVEAKQLRDDILRRECRLLPNGEPVK